MIKVKIKDDNEDWLRNNRKDKDDESEDDKKPKSKKKKDKKAGTLTERIVQRVASVDSVSGPTVHVGMDKSKQLPDGIRFCRTYTSQARYRLLDIGERELTPELKKKLKDIRDALNAFDEEATKVIDAWGE